MMKEAREIHENYTLRENICIYHTSHLLFYGNVIDVITIHITIHTDYLCCVWFSSENFLMHSFRLDDVMPMLAKKEDRKNYNRIKWDKQAWE